MLSRRHWKHRQGGVFVEEIRGSYSGVVGLPVFETVKLLEEAGIRVL